MISKSDLNRISDYVWEIPQNYRQNMRVPARIFISEKMLDDVLKDRSLDQLVNVAVLPGIQKWAIAMPDIHEGYGFPIGGVAAMSLKDGVISPGGIGYDINCGVRLLKTQSRFDEIKNKIKDLTVAIYKEVPSGVGKGGRLDLSNKELEEVLIGGAKKMVKSGYGFEEDLARCEANGCLGGVDALLVSQIAKKRGKGQLGTMGAGNHFVEVQRVEKIFNPEAAKKMGLFEGQITILIHCGSRGLGHQVATDYIKIFVGALKKYNIDLPDRELACAPFNSEEGQNYFKAMKAAANFAWANRQVIAWEVRRAWDSVIGDGDHLKLIYDVAHNIAKIEKYLINNKEEELIIHRKGATRSFGLGEKELPEEYQSIGQPVLIPGSMGTASYILIGANQSKDLSFSSACHGAGRTMSRMAAKRQVRGSELKQELEKQGIDIESGSMSGLAEEAPLAYKNVDDVVDIVDGAGIAKKVARLKPVGVVKG